MKKRIGSKKLSITILAVAALAAVWAVMPATRVAATAEVNEKPSPLGIAAGQMVRVSIFNRGETSAYIPDWRIKFFDSDGNLLQLFDGRALSPGQMVSVDLDGDSLESLRDAFGRAQIRAEVSANGIASREILGLSIEVFNKADSKTTVFVGDVND